jgi:hypothetical protein
MAREEALGQLQRERAALEEAEATLQKQERRCRASTGSWCRSTSRMRTSASPSRSRRPRTSSCSARLRRRASPLRWRRSRLKVSLFSSGFWLLIRSLFC